MLLGVLPIFPSTVSGLSARVGARDNTAICKAIKFYTERGGVVVVVAVVAVAVAIAGAVAVVR